MDNQYLDIRTLNFIVILFSCIYSISLLCYQYTQGRVKGLKTFSISLLFIGLGPFLLGFRGSAPDWLTIVIANTLILVGFLLTLYSVSIFRQYPLKLAHCLTLLTPVFSGSFYYFTFHDPSIKSRIIYLSTYICIVTFFSGVAMLKGTQKDLKLPVKAMAYSFFGFSFFMGFRALWSTFSGELPSFMVAGLIHQLTFLFSICLIVALSFSMLWLINGRLVQSINDLSHLDALTGLYNRRAMEEIVPNLVSKAHKKNQAISIIMTDVDKFKAINDHYGHTVGDSVMATISTIFKKHLPESACIVRFGGDEFMIVLLEKAQQAKIFAEQIRLAVETETALQSFKTEVTMSFGISQLSEGQSLQEALAEADEALYSSKHTGRNLVTLFGEGKDLNYKFVPAPAKSA
ncbi:TPA: GGDEF domain-containing protein [Vibrio alginolyticus]|nr:GGDEF domain-containing protein [Vibrio alginolyticus]HCZ9300793.1 GGDEF domain-containing protein [Vibrio alginolyticus]